jgi:hypothetical protein
MGTDLIVHDSSYISVKVVNVLFALCNGFVQRLNYWMLMLHHIAVSRTSKAIVICCFSDFIWSNHSQFSFMQWDALIPESTNSAGDPALLPAVWEVCDNHSMLALPLMPCRFASLHAGPH